jgi:hypothetical protein
VLICGMHEQFRLFVALYELFVFCGMHVNILYYLWSVVDNLHELEIHK